MTDAGFLTPEAAAPGDIPAQYVTVVGTLVVGDDATVWMLTNDGPAYEPYTVQCFREDGRWYGGSGICGFSDYGLGFPPEAVITAARKYYSGPL